MKIALVNYRYFISGGPERYMFNIKEILEQNGHQVIPFSVKHQNNVKSEYEHLFLSPIGSGTEVYFSDYKKTLRDTIKGFSRMTYSFEAKRTFKKFLKEVKPDIIYILYFQSKISCSIVDIAYQMKIPVVQRISDYSMLTPCNILYQPREKNICEKCIQNNLWAIQKKCIYNSSVYSAVKVLALWIQKLVGTRKKISTFIFPSQFTMNKYIEGGYTPKKLAYIPTPFNHNVLRKDLEVQYNDFALYIGRVDPDKGLDTLINAFINTNHKLKIIGFSSVKGYQEKLEAKLKNKTHHIEFLGKMEFDQMQEYLSKCLFTIIPSEWYDNLPNTILEAYAFKKCIIATDIGSLSENVIHQETGLLFEYKNSKDLAQKADYLFNNPEKAIEMGEKAVKKIESLYSAKEHYTKLMEIFHKV